MEIKNKQEYKKPEISELSSAIATKGMVKGAQMDESLGLHDKGNTAS